MQSNQNSSFSTRRLLTTIAVVGLASSSVVSAAPTTNATSEANTFGTVTSGSSECVVGNPNAYISAKYIDWVWDNRLGPKTYRNVPANKNWIIDHLVKNKGTINYCIRWDSKTKLTKSVASKFEAMLNRQYKAWNQWLIGYDCWPYNDIKVKITGFAVKDSSALDWNDNSLGKIYEGELDGDGYPRCSQGCYRFYDNGAAAWSDTSSCQAQPWDIYLWPRAGLEGGLGDDSGQEVNMENMLASLDDEQLTIIAHEIGHGFGLPDFYESSDKPANDFPACLMDAGTSATVTPSDGWMLRRVLEHTKSRYSF
ncbi:Neutral zinc metallopeptidase, Zn-binding site [Phytophthora cinnamomi]|uniref:Neutral zinc metallopeptidase, Zn-binding site n=1 Tax=Phytophthora cinnamomi TaxID=4785 RepID=UPI003559FB6A|nr:Neutral zinc metallopeptidase, Zn-binding site [Phytophthora cinnamomi]